MKNIGLLVLLVIAAAAYSGMHGSETPPRPTPAPSARTPSAAIDCKPFAEYASCAIGIGGLGSRVLAAAFSCGLTAKRALEFTDRLGVMIKLAAVSDKDQGDAVRLADLAGKETWRRIETKTEKVNCAQTMSALADLEQKLGLR